MFFFFSSRRRHTRWPRDWSSDVCSSDLDQKGKIVDALDEKSQKLKKHNQQLLEDVDQKINKMVTNLNEQVEEIKEQQRSEEHTSELQSRGHLVCRLLLEKKKTKRLTQLKQT